MRSFIENERVERSMNAVAAGADDTQAGTAIDTAGFDSIAFVVALGAIVATGNGTIKLQQGALSNGTDAADLEDASIAFTDADANKVFVLECYRPREQYVRPAIVRAADANVTIDGAIAILRDPQDLPVTQGDAVGELRECPKWYVDLRDHHGTRQRFAGSEDRHETAEFGRMLEDLVRCRKRAVQPKDRLWNWLMGLPVDVQGKLVELDLAEKTWFTALSQSDRLSVWVDDFEAWLRTSKGKNGYHRNAGHVQVTMHRVRAIAAGCGFKTWADIRKGAVETYLGGLSVEIGTHNGYITAFKHFTTWCVKDGRAEFSPVQYMDRVTQPQKEKRRPLAADEVRKLLWATVNGPRRYCMTGLERAVLYRLGIETGYRANELRHLTAGCFDLDNATVSLSAEFCKDRRDATQPITMALAGALRGFLDGKAPTDWVFALHTPKTALMIQADAGEAGLPLMDDRGRELVFHSLRHTLRTELERARVSDGVIDTIMRHKPKGVGKTFYRHVSDFEIREGIERLTSFQITRQR